MVNLNKISFYMWRCVMAVMCMKCHLSAQLTKAYIQSCWSVVNDMLTGVSCQLGKEFNIDIPISSVSG